MYVERGMMRIKSTFTMSPALITLILLGRPIGKWLWPVMWTLKIPVTGASLMVQEEPTVWCGERVWGDLRRQGATQPVPRSDRAHTPRAREPQLLKPVPWDQRGRHSERPEHQGSEAPAPAARESQSPAVETQRSPKRYLLQLHFKVSLWVNNSVYHIYCLTYGKAQDFLSVLVPPPQQKD